MLCGAGEGGIWMWTISGPCGKWGIWPKKRNSGHPWLTCGIAIPYLWPRCGQQKPTAHVPLFHRYVDRMTAWQCDSVGQTILLCGKDDVLKSQWFKCIFNTLAQQPYPNCHFNKECFLNRSQFRYWNERWGNSNLDISACKCIVLRLTLFPTIPQRSLSIVVGRFTLLHFTQLSDDEVHICDTGSCTITRIQGQSLTL